MCGINYREITNIKSGANNKIVTIKCNNTQINGYRKRENRNRLIKN